MPGLDSQRLNCTDSNLLSILLGHKKNILV